MSNARQIERFLPIVVDTIKAAKPDKNAPIATADALKILEAFTLTSQPRAIELKIDLAIILKNLHLLSNLAAPLGNPTPEDLPKIHAAIAESTVHGVPIDDKITVEQLGRDFLADSLKSYPSEHPVAPGSGLEGSGTVQIGPAPEPAK